MAVQALQGVDSANPEYKATDGAGDQNDQTDQPASSKVAAEPEPLGRQQKRGRERRDGQQTAVFKIA